MPNKATVHKMSSSNQIKRPARLSATERGYDRRWQREKAIFLKEHPLCECEECKRLGRIRVANTVDHKQPHKGDMTLFWDKRNWQAMAKECHDRKTAREDGGFGNNG